MPKAGTTDANKHVVPPADPAANMASNEGLDLSDPENQPPATPALDSATPQAGDGSADPAPPDLPELNQPAAQLEDLEVDGDAVQVKIVNAIELKPESKYIILLDENTYSRAEASQILDSVRAIGINNAVALMTSQAHSVQIIEQEKA